MLQLACVLVWKLKFVWTKCIYFTLTKAFPFVGSDKFVDTFHSDTAGGIASEDFNQIWQTFSEVLQIGWTICSETEITEEEQIRRQKRASQLVHVISCKQLNLVITYKIRANSKTYYLLLWSCMVNLALCAHD